MGSMSGMSPGAAAGTTSKTWDHDWERQVHIHGLFGNPLVAKFTPKPWWTHACRCSDYTVHGDAYNFDASDLRQRYWIIKMLDASGQESVDFDTYWNTMQSFAKKNLRVNLREQERKYMLKERAEWIKKNGEPVVERKGAGDGVV